MGGKSSQEQTQSSTTAPWAPAQPMLQGILGQLQGQLGNTGLTGTETGALNSLQNNANQGNPYANQIGANATSLLNGGGANGQAGAVQNGFNQYQSQLSPYANGSMIGNNPALKAQLDGIMSDVGNNVNSQFAAAGRDMSGANQQAYGRGVAQGVAPVLANQYNQDVQNQLGAAGSLYNAGNSTSGLLSGMQQQDQQNRQAGTGAAGNAIDAQNSGANQSLAIEAQRRGIPVQNLGMLAQIGVPIAGLGSQSTGHSTGTQQMSGAQQFQAIGSGIGSMMPKAPMSMPGKS